MDMVDAFLEEAVDDGSECSRASYFMRFDYNRFSRNYYAYILENEAVCGDLELLRMIFGSMRITVSNRDKYPYTIEGYPLPLDCNNAQEPFRSREYLFQYMADVGLLNKSGTDNRIRELLVGVFNGEITELSADQLNKLIYTIRSLVIDFEVETRINLDSLLYDDVSRDLGVVKFHDPWSGFHPDPDMQTAVVYGGYRSLDHSGLSDTSI